MIKKLIRLFLILAAILMLPSASGALAKDAQVTALRWTSRNDGNPPFVRIAMDLSKAVHAEAAIDDAGKNFEVVLKKTSMGSVASQYDMDPRAIDFATLSEKTEIPIWTWPSASPRKSMISVFSPSVPMPK